MSRRPQRPAPRAAAVLHRHAAGTTGATWCGGRAGLAQLADTFVSDPRRHFAEGQSVRAAVAARDAPRGRFALSLKPALVTAADGAYLASLFRDLEFAEGLR